MTKKGRTSPTADQNELYDEIYQTVESELNEMNEEDWRSGVSIRETIEDAMGTKEAKKMFRGRHEDIENRMVQEMEHQFKKKLKKAKKKKKTKKSKKDKKAKKAKTKRARRAVTTLSDIISGEPQLLGSLYPSDIPKRIDTDSIPRMRRQKPTHKPPKPPKHTKKTKKVTFSRDS